MNCQFGADAFHTPAPVYWYLMSHIFLILNHSLHVMPHFVWLDAAINKEKKKQTTNYLTIIN